MTFAELKALDETYVMHTYGRFPVDIDHGQGATLYSLSGRKYIDFTSGIGVNSLGYGNPKWMAAITEQIGKLGHISNLFYTQPGTLLAQQLCTRSGMDKVFFGNSGAEANEAMIKVARKYSFDKYGKGMGAQGCVSWSFDRKGVIIIDNEDGDYDEDAVMMDALDAGADDFNAEDNVFEITTDPDAFNDVVKALEEKNYAFVSADISLVPQTYVKLESDEDIKNMEKLLDMLDDNEDVQNTYHNWDQD